MILRLRIFFLTLAVLGSVVYAQEYAPIPVLTVKTELQQPIDLTLENQLQFALSPAGPQYSPQPVRVWIFHGSKDALMRQKSLADAGGCVRYTYWEIADGTINGHLDLLRQPVSRAWFAIQNGAYRSDTWVLVPVASAFRPDGVLWLHKEFVDTFFNAGIEINAIPPANIGTPEAYQRELYGHTFEAAAAAASPGPVAPPVTPISVRKLCVNRTERVGTDFPGTVLAMARPCSIGPAGAGTPPLLSSGNPN